MNAKHLLSIFVLIGNMGLTACSNSESNDIIEEKETLAQQLYIYKPYEQDQGFNNESIGGIFKLYNESPNSYTHISVRNYYCVTDCKDFLSEDEKQNMYQSSSFPIDTLYLSGLKNNRLWVAAYNTISKKKLFEMTSSNTIEMEYVKHMGYRENKTLNLESIHIGYKGDSNHNDYWWYTDKYKAIRFVASYRTESNEYDTLPYIILAQNESCQVTQSDYMIPWYNDSFLFKFKRQSVSGGEWDFYGYYNNGDFENPILESGQWGFRLHITHPEYLCDENHDYVHSLFYDRIITGSIDDNHYSINIWELEKEVRPDFFDFEYRDWKRLFVIDLKHKHELNDKYNIKIIEKKCDDNGLAYALKIQLNVLRYNGEKINDEYVISLNEGIIIEHNGQPVQE